MNLQDLSKQRVEFETLTMLNGYHYKLLRFETHDRGLSIVRAYNPHNHTDYIDIHFLSTGFVRLRSFWNDLPLTMASQEEVAEICPRLRDNSCKNHQLYRFGAHSSGFYVLAFSVEGIRANYPEDDWLQSVSQTHPSERDSTKELEKLSKLPHAKYHYYVAAINPQSNTLMLAAMATTKETESYVIAFDGVEFLQLPSGWFGASFDIVEKKEQEHFCGQHNLPTESQLILLKNEAHQMPVYILCGGVRVVSAKK